MAPDRIVTTDGVVAQMPHALWEDVKARIAELEENVARLQRIIDSRPAINAGLPQTYIEWSQSIYTLDVVHAGGVPKH